jgi:hypothetical protein
MQVEEEEEEEVGLEIGQQKMDPGRAGWQAKKKD